MQDQSLVSQQSPELNAAGNQLNDTRAEDEPVSSDEVDLSAVETEVNVADVSIGETGERRTFATILEGLRTVEDTFYFLVEEGPGQGTRFPIDGSELILGWSATAESLSTDPGAITSPCAVVRKDWTGVMIQPQSPALLVLNGQPLKIAQRLRNGDRLMLSFQLGSATKEASLIFHEPASLVVLDSLLPNKLPPPVTRSVEHMLNPEPNPASEASYSAGTPGGRTYFGYFSLYELLMMGAGSLTLAAIIFLVLDNT